MIHRVVLGLLACAVAQAQTTPVKHLVVIFQENVSFDHYFATYPVAANPEGEPAFAARPSTPAVNGLGDDLLTNNPSAAAPFRLSRSPAVTCDHDHGYTHGQQAMNGRLMDKFIEFTAACTSHCQ